MKFVWEISEKDWGNYPKLIKECCDFDGIINTAGVVGSCRIGDLIFDIRAWGDYEHGCGLGYELFVGGIETGYNETFDGYPYDAVEEYDEFPISVLEMKLEEFEKMAEPVFEKFIKDVNCRYKLADLLAKANEPTNFKL